MMWAKGTAWCGYCGAVTWNLILLLATSRCSMFFDEAFTLSIEFFSTVLSRLSCVCCCDIQSYTSAGICLLVPRFSYRDCFADCKCYMQDFLRRLSHCCELSRAHSVIAAYHRQHARSLLALIVLLPREYKEVCLFIYDVSCHFVSLLVILCHCVSLSVIVCHCTSLYVTVCHCTSLFLTMYRICYWFSCVCISLLLPCFDRQMFIFDFCFLLMSDLLYVLLLYST